MMRFCLVSVLLFLMVCATYIVFAQDAFELKLSFVESDVLLIGIAGDSRSSVCLYDVSEKTFEQLAKVSGGQMKLNERLLANPPGFLWRLDDSVILVDEHGSPQMSDTKLDADEELEMAFPKDNMALWRRQLGPGESVCTFTLRDRTGNAVEELEVPIGIGTASPAFGKDYGFFLLIGETLQEARESMRNMPEEEIRGIGAYEEPVISKASLCSITPLATVFRDHFPRWAGVEFVQDPKSDDLIAVLHSMLLKHQFVRVTPVTQEEVLKFEVEEFASCESLTATWRNGYIFSSGSIGSGLGITIEECGTENAESILIPFPKTEEGVPLAEDFAVNRDGSIVCVYGSRFLELWKINFPEKTFLGRCAVELTKWSGTPSINEVEYEPPSTYSLPSSQQ